MKQKVQQTAENLFVRYLSRTNFLPSLRDEDMEESKDGYFIRKGHNHFINIRDVKPEEAENQKRWRISRPFAERVAREAIEDAQIFHTMLKKAFPDDTSP